jgi:hypothetical protein
MLDGQVISQVHSSTTEAPIMPSSRSALLLSERISRMLALGQITGRLQIAMERNRSRWARIRLAIQVKVDVLAWLQEQTRPRQKP